MNRRSGLWAPRNPSAEGRTKPAASVVAAVHERQPLADGGLVLAIQDGQVDVRRRLTGTVVVAHLAVHDQLVVLGIDSHARELVESAGLQLDGLVDGCVQMGAL